MTCKIQLQYLFANKMIFVSTEQIIYDLRVTNKKEPLTDTDKESIKRHPIIAAREILKPITKISDITDIIPIIEKHHENWNGSGYPENLAKDDIPMTSQIVLIVDAYYALIEDRAYRKKMTPVEALEIIKKDAGVKWNENLVKEFVALIENELK